MSAPELSKASILLIDDNPSDRLLARRAMDVSGRDVPMSTAGSVDEGLAFLRSDAATPDIILLDLNMPRRNGFDFLDALEATERHIPVVVLTTSNYERDVERARIAGAAGYTIKPMEFEQFVGLMQRLADIAAGKLPLPDGPLLS